MPVGTSPGAVTAAMAYLNHTYGNEIARHGRTIDELILFTTRAVKEGEAKAENSIWNHYGKGTAYKSFDKQEKVFEVIEEFYQREIKPSMLKPRKAKPGENNPPPAVYWCEAFADFSDDAGSDYERSLRSAAEVLVLHLSKPETTGKQVWINLTGGTNVMNAALLQVAYLSGLVARLYYTFAPRGETQFLQPASDYFKYVEVPLLKTAPDEAHLAVLEALATFAGEWVDSQTLLDFLKPYYAKEFPDAPGYFQTVTIEAFRREFLNKLDGRGLERREENGEKLDWVKLSDDGAKLLKQMNDEIFRALTKRGQTAQGALEGKNFTHGWEKLDW